MNLHAVAGPIVGAVNPSIIGLYQASTGSTTAPNGTRSPGYADAVRVEIQMQMLTFKDLQQVDGMNLNGEKRAMYISGRWEGVSRPEARGGDLVTLPDSSVWLVSQVLENWATTDCWTKVAVVKQDGA